MPTFSKKEVRSFDNLSQAESFTGIPIAKLKLAKSMGAPGFRGSRIYFDDLEPWYLENKDKLHTLITKNDGLSINDIKRNNAILDGELMEQKKKINEFIIQDKANSRLQLGEMQNLLATIGLSINLKFNEYRSSLTPSVLGKPQEKVQPIVDKMFDDIISWIHKGEDSLIKIAKEKGIDESGSTENIN